MNADLSGVLVKIDRAKTHLNDFDRRARRIEDACRRVIVRERDEQRSEYVFRFSRIPTLRPVLGAVIGDAIHNLRVALDHLAWQLVIASGGKPRSQRTTTLPSSIGSTSTTSIGSFSLPLSASRASVGSARSIRLHSTLVPIVVAPKYVGSRIPPRTARTISALPSPSRYDSMNRRRGRGARCWERPNSFAADRCDILRMKFCRDSRAISNFYSDGSRG